MSNYPLLSVYGIELEYMIVNRATLNALPIADKLLIDDQGVIENEIEHGEVAISNELAMHVLEMKTNGPKPQLRDLDQQFHREVLDLNLRLQAFNACLMPSGAHPWFNPERDFSLWPHGDRAIYAAFHRIFNCEGHGWSNLQSTHINLPFANDDEFRVLHSAIRLVLPLIPALCASSPFLDGKLTDTLDTRLVFYGQNQKKIPIIAGPIIPEFVRSHDEYESKILQPIYQAIAPFDTDNVLQNEWLNSRGAITRFERNAIEIRVMDIQECPLADLACVAGIVGIIKYLINNTHAYVEKPMSSDALRSIYDEAIRHGLAGHLRDDEFAKQFQIERSTLKNFHHILGTLFETASSEIDPKFQTVLETILSKGNLAQRMVTAFSKNNAENLHSIYHALCQSLEKNTLFLP